MTDNYKKICFLSGAGVSAESGISTFRDSNGLWENYRVEDVASIDGWYKNRNLVNDFYNQLAIRAIKALDTEFGGVDIIAENISKPSKCAINEVNYNPGLRLHYKVDKGQKTEVAVPIMEYIRDKYLS